MKTKLIVIMFFVLWFDASNAQVDFSIFLNKKEMKNNYRGLFYNFRDYGKMECVSGNCKNGKSAFMVSSSQFKLYIIGNFKDKEINGGALILRKGTTSNFDSKIDKIISAYDQNSKSLKQLFNSNKEQFFEGYYGIFRNNVLVNDGEYFLNAKFKQIIKNKQWRYSHLYRLHNMTLPHLNFINQTYKDRDITYYYKGNFNQDANEKPEFSFKTDEEYAVIRTKEFPKIVLKAAEDNARVYQATYYNNYNMVISEEDFTSNQIKNAYEENKIKAKKFREQQKAKALEEEKRRISRIKASSPCNVIGEWITPNKLPNYSGGSVCTKNGTLVPFSWKHPMITKVSLATKRYGGTNVNSVYFPRYSTENSGTYNVYANSNDIAYKGDKIFVTTEFNANQYSVCASCFSTGKLYIGDENPNTLQRTSGWFLVYDYSDTRGRVSSSKTINAEARQVYYNQFKDNGNPGLQWQEEFKAGFNYLPCLNCYGMGCVVK